jgi:hypothetical protein
MACDEVRHRIGRPHGIAWRPLPPYCSGVTDMHEANGLVNAVMKTKTLALFGLHGGGRDGLLGAAVSPKRSAGINIEDIDGVVMGYSSTAVAMLLRSEMSTMV